MKIDDDRICIYCKHRDFAHEIKLPVWRNNGLSMEDCAPCLLQASDCESGPGVHMYAEDGHCIYHDDAFEPSDKYFEMLAEARSQREDERELKKWLAYA